MVFLFENMNTGGLGSNDFSFMNGKMSFGEFVEKYRKTKRSEGFVPLSEVLLVLSEALQYNKIQATSISGIEEFKCGVTHRIRGLELCATRLNKGEYFG